MPALETSPDITEPKQARAIRTRETLLDVAGALLEDVGLETISTNMVAARAGMTPPALYRYFRNKHDLIAALGRRLMERQNAVLEQWVGRHATGGAAALAEHIEELLHETAVATDAEPGGSWIVRALRASPRLAGIRVESHRAVTAMQVEAYRDILPGLDADDLWRRVRLAVEFGFAALEMRDEEDRIDDETLFAETARAIRQILLGDEA